MLSGRSRGGKNSSMISIVTPTYNRASTLPRLYESLVKQTKKAFEWILIDDGSTDGTELLAKKWKQASFSFTYVKKENGGKHTAINMAVLIAKGDFIFIVDSDDYLLEDAIEKVEGWIEQIKGKKKFAGVSGLRGYSKEKVIGKRPARSVAYVDGTNLERRKNHLSGDKAEIYRRDLLLSYPFPVFEGERFVTEATVWNAIARDGYQLRWFNEIIYIGEYQEDGLTKGKDLRYTNPKGCLYYEQMMIPLYRGIEKWWKIGKLIDLLYIIDGTCKKIRQYVSLTKLEVVLGYLLCQIWNLLRKGKRLWKKILQK